MPSYLFVNTYFAGCHLLQLLSATRQLLANPPEAKRGRRNSIPIASSPRSMRKITPWFKTKGS